MILRRVRLHPFGCITDRAFELEPGLNVVLGPNEAGKSTLFRAIRFALFVRTDLTKRRREELVDPHLPVSGGDTIRVELALAAAGEQLTVRRRWGASPGSELLLPGGGSLSEEETIAAKLGALLPARPATAANILMTEQSSLADTLELLRDEKNGHESLADLADILRRAVLSTGGVSVDRFMARVEAMRAEAWSRWDAVTAAPEDGRGLDRRWKQNVGTVLAAWYAREEARAAFGKAEEHDAALDRVNSQLRSAAAALAEAQGFMHAHADAARDARTRRELEADLDATRARLQDMVKTSLEWPVAASRARELEAAAAAAGPARAALEREAEAAQKAELARGLREKADRVARRRAARDEASARWKTAARLEKKDLDAIRAAAAAADRAAARLDAGKMTLTVAGRAAVELGVQEDFSPEERRSLSPGATLRLTASGRLRLVHRDMEIEVRSGTTDAAAAAEAASAAASALAALLQQHGLAGVEEAEERGRATEALAADLRAAEKNLADELGGEPLAAIDERLTALGPVVEGRALATVKEEIGVLRARMEEGARELTDINRRTVDWASRYGSPESLVTELGKAKAREADRERRISGAAPLPPGYASAEAFLEAFDEAQAAAAHGASELRVLEERKRNLEDAAPSQSAEELHVLAADAEEAFESVRRRAEALDRVAAQSAALLASSNSSVYAGMTGQLTRFLSLMTEGRHDAPVMDGPLPVGLSGGRGRAIPWEFLSAGTRDTLALALRLAMALYFLGDEDGFMLLDDPLVDMDPARQRAAAAALKDFGSRRQLVVFTCHPATAELLGGTRVLLDDTDR